MRGATRKQILARRAFRNYLTLSGLHMHVAPFYPQRGPELVYPHAIVTDHDGRCWWVDVPGVGSKAHPNNYNSMRSDFDDQGMRHPRGFTVNSAVAYAKIVIGYYRGNGKESGFWAESIHKGLPARLARIRLRRKHARIYNAARNRELALPVCLDAVPD